MMLNDLGSFEMSSYNIIHKSVWMGMRQRHIVTSAKRTNNQPHVIISGSMVSWHHSHVRGTHQRELTKYFSPYL